MCFSIQITTPPAVYSIFLIETLQTALTGADIYYWFVTGFGDMDHLAGPYASAFDVPIIGSFVSLTVQYLFVYRIWVLGNRSRRVLPICALICVVSRSYRDCVVPMLHHCPTFQCSAVDAIAAFYGGVYVGLVNYPKLFPIQLTSCRLMLQRNSIVHEC